MIVIIQELCITYIITEQVGIVSGSIFVHPQCVLRASGRCLIHSDYLRVTKHGLRLQLHTTEKEKKGLTNAHMNTHTRNNVTLNVYKSLPVH